MKLDTILKIIIIVFIGTAFFNNPETKSTIEDLKNAKENIVAATTSPEKKELEPEGNFLEKSISKVAVNVLKTTEGRAFFENMITPINIKSKNDNDIVIKSFNPEIVASLLNLKVIQPGEGPQAICGQDVTIGCEIMNSENFIIQPKTKYQIRLGNRTVIPAIENIVTGMKRGERREAISPSIYAYDIKKFRRKDVAFGAPVKIKVYLDQISSPNSFNQDEVKIFDDYIAYKIPLLCGDNINAHIKITKFNGDIIFNSKKTGKLSLRVGSRDYPIIFGYALQYKIPVGIRVAITPGKYLRSFSVDGLSKIFPNNSSLPDLEEYYMVEFSDIDAPQY
jgi:hypothetical protein